MHRRQLSLLVMVLVPLCYQPAMQAQQLEPVDVVGRPAVASDSIPVTIAEAEAQARQRMSVPASDTLPYHHVPFNAGGSERRCVDVGTARDQGSTNVRSADFVVLGFSAYAGLWHAGFGKLAWLPVNGSTKSPQHLVLSASRLDAVPTPRVYHVELNRGQYYMYPADIRLPGTGRWLLVGRAGRSWGCFACDMR